MKYKDYYKILSVDRNAKEEDIKKAYRRLARKFHPDVSKERNAEERFKEISEAYEVLRDKEKRAAYDQLGQHRTGEEFRPPPGWGDRYAHGPDASSQFGNADLFDLFADLFGGGGSRAGHHARGVRIPRPGQDYEVVAHLNLEQAYHGTEIELDLVVPDHGGIKTQQTPKKIKVRIPKGVTDGQKLRVPGKGGPGSNGGPAGALYLDISLRPHPLFKPSGHDLYLEVPITPWEAMLGTSIEVPTLEGRVRIKINPGTRAGQKLRISNRGLPKPSGGHGDLYAVLQIVTPTVYSAREKELFEELSRLSTFNPRGHFEQ